MLTLGIESSCDETGVAIVRDGSRVLSNVVHTQIPIHARYGGVVPELASRNHVMAIGSVLQRALDDAQVGLRDLDLIAVTVGPGLVGSLMVGLETAKALAYVCDVPLQGVNHLEGHLLSPLIDEECQHDVSFPYVALVVSGGHTSLILVEGIGSYETLGRTIDDAAGEAFDKVAKRLGAEYPGGPFIDRMAQQGDLSRFHLPRPMLGRGLDFSFSGLKTAAATLISKQERVAPVENWLADVCAATQDAIVSVLVHKATRAVQQCGINRLVIAGGVACNGGLRDRMRQVASNKNFELLIPAPRFCTDNGAMIACAGALRFSKAPRRGFGEFDQDVFASLPVSAEI